MNRQGRPADNLDAVLCDIRRVWGEDARIDITEDPEGGQYVVTVSVVKDAADPIGDGIIRVDTRYIKAAPC